MALISVGRSTFKRQVGKIPSIVLRNRFFEQNPVLNAQEDFVSLISRPALRKFIEVGGGPIRFTFDEPGTFDDDLFVVSGTGLHRVTAAGVSTYIGELGTSPIGSVSMAATGRIGETPEYLFIADGGVLWVYLDDGSALGQLEASGAILNNDTISIAGIYYRWTNGSVNAGSPAGTLANPWLVNLGGTNAEAITAMFKAINGAGVPGTDYSTALTIHPTVTAYSAAANDLFVAAKTPGIAGNSIAVTETGANLTWVGGATLTGGGTPQLRQVAVPDDLGAVSIAVINSYVIVVPVQGRGTNGQFYWIEPGELTIDPLNFATAERSPDPINQVVVFSDRFWLLGKTTTEPWVTTGNPEAPMQRFSGVLYDRGAWEGTAMRVKDSMIVVDEDGAVFQIAGGLKRISRPDIEERIRRAIQRQARG
jgi:hypothetical protein